MPKFLHAADLHIDSPLRNLQGFGEAEAARLREATRQALMNLVDLALREQVAFVVLAGDLFDNDNPSIGSTLFFVKALRRLTEAAIPVYVLRGNHDFASREGSKLWPDGVHEFSAEAPQTFTVPGHAVVLHGQSYPTKAVEIDMTPGYPAPVIDHLNIGVLHTALEGHAGEHARYAPATPATLANKGYAYWALGHVHTFIPLNVNGTHIVYPGNLQGRHVRETGPKGVAIVAWEGTRIVDVRHEPLDVVRWHDLTVELDAIAEHGKATNDEAIKAITHHVAEATRDDASAGRMSAIRLRLAALPGDLLSGGLVPLRDRITASISARVGDHVALEEVRVIRTTRLELPSVLQAHVDRARDNLVVLGGDPDQDPARDFTSRLWQQIEGLGEGARARIREELGIDSEVTLRAKLIDLGAQRLAARIAGGR
jgi:DNA repair exonuclease SbcCD nuclease subunit